MKQNLLKTMMLLCMLFVGIGAWAGEETYTFSSFTSGQDVTLNATNFTIKLHKNTGTSNPAWSSNQARVYAKGSLEISSQKTITKIVYAYTINENKSGKAPTIDGVEGSTNAGNWDSETKTWTGNDTDVTLSTSGEAGNVGFTSVTVTYEGTAGKETTTLAWSAATATVTINANDNVFPTLTTTPADLTGVTYSSSNEEAATINATTGVITLVSAGATTITASYEGDATHYAAAPVSYDLTVKAAPVSDGYTHDVLTNADFAATNTTYTEFSDVKKNTAVYAGQSAKNNGIQLRSNNSNSGIVSTVSGGKIKKVIVTWNSNCAADRALSVYGSNTAYTNATELYGEALVGEKIGTIENGTSTELTVTGDYKYVGVRSSSGALNMDAIEFVWDETNEIPTFESLEALIAADQSYDAVNVTVDDEVYLAAVDPDMPGFYAVLLKNSGVMLASSGEDLGWQAGGKVTGTLTNVQWNKDDGVAGALMSKKPFWSDLTYTAPEVLVFNSIDELVAANLANGTAVTVTIEGTIKRAEYSAHSKSYAVELDNNNLNLGSFTGKDYGWEIGGTVTGTLENVTYITENGEPGGEPGLASLNKDIFADLTYTAPAKGTLNFVASNKDGYWATFSSTKDVIFDANDVVVYTVAADGDDLDMIDANNNSLSCVTDKSKDDGWVAGYYVQAGAGVLVNSLENSVNYYYTTTDPYTENILTEIETDPELNMLRPASAAMESTGYVFYKLAYASEAKDALGFYWGAADGAAFKSRYGAAYLAVPASQTSAKGFAFDSESTGIKSVETSNSKAPAYNIAGQRVNANVKGIVIMNGKKYINK